MNGQPGRSLRIENRGVMARVEYGGNDIGSALTGLTLRIDAGRVPVVTLDMAVVELALDGDDVTAIIPDRVADLLVRLGWQPPAEEQPAEEPTPPPTFEWYYGPTEWDPDPGHMWHQDCPDTFRTGHDGEVWIDKDSSEHCTGCATIHEPAAEEQP